MNKKQITEIIDSSLDELFLKDKAILFESYDLHERSIVHRLAMYMETHFSKFDYYVDVEYNRMRNNYGEDVIGNVIGKAIDFEKSGEGSSYVYPDLIVHKRDTENNLLEVEVKMKWKNKLKELDYLKINEYVNQLGYKFGVYLELSDKRDECKIEFSPFL